jgi:transcriptional regulator with XRE-family HTH domain
VSEMTDQDLGARIKVLREERAMTQAALGKAMGVDQSTVSRIEDGARAITAGELAAVSSAFGVTVGTLFTEDAAPALLRAGEGDDQAVQESLRVFSDCIDELRGIEALAG